MDAFQGGELPLPTHICCSYLLDFLAENRIVDKKE